MNFLLLSAIGFAAAQDWSKDDSLWLLNVLEGKHDLKLNDDTKKAIEDGTLVVPPWLKDDPFHSKPELIRELEQAGVRDTAHVRSLDPYSMPPAVYAMYVLYMEKIDSAYASSTCMLSEDDRRKLEEVVPLNARNLFYFDEQVGGIGSLDFNHVLCMLFHPGYRRKMYNRKHATAYKNYYDAGSVPTIQISERERRQLRKAVNNLKVSPINTGSPGVKRGGIDK
jgi:hypothetical protein